MNFINDKRAATTVEYALAAGIVAATLVFTQLGLGTRLCNSFREVQYARAISQILPPCPVENRAHNLR
ncbi:MAG: Flp family type IVb pilin [Hyphomicrobiales bacterium]